ncbi:hypothetical protein B566_EDAN013475, partial [Ephemera danica]
TPRPFIQCPGDVHVNLSPGRSTAQVRISRPKSNMEWTRYVHAQPVWGKQLETELGPGTHQVMFTAVSPWGPEVQGCPNNFEQPVREGYNSRQVYWREPVFTDNVEVVNVYKNKEPGSVFSVGAHQVTYTARDAAGNRAHCSFTVTLTRPSASLPQRSAPRKLMVCPGRTPGKVKPVYPWQIPQGCHMQSQPTIPYYRQQHVAGPRRPTDVTDNSRLLLFRGWQANPTQSNHVGYGQVVRRRTYVRRACCN